MILLPLTMKIFLLFNVVASITSYSREYWNKKLLGGQAPLEELMLINGMQKIGRRGNTRIYQMLSF